jgi:hypothetical protein
LARAAHRLFRYSRNNSYYFLGAPMMYPGLLVTEHSVPPAALICDLKICENCGVPFMRKQNGGTLPFKVKQQSVEGLNCADGLNGSLKELRRDVGVRYCVRCQAKALAPVDLSEYKDQLPGTEIQMRHAMHLPKTDESLLKVQQANRKCGRRFGDWRTRLLVAFARRGPLSMNQILEITGHSSACSIHSGKFELKSVGSVWPRKRGTPAWLYLPKELTGVTQT